MTQQQHEQELHDQIEQYIHAAGHQSARKILSAWLLALSRQLGEEFVIAGQYRITVRKLH